MLIETLRFDIEAWLKRKFFRYISLISIFVFTSTAVLTMLLFVPTVQNVTGLSAWSDNLLLSLGLIWALLSAMSLVCLIKLLKTSVSRLIKISGVLNTLAIVALIAVATIMPDQQTCGINQGCEYFIGNALLYLIVLEFILVGIWWRMWSYEGSPLRLFSKTK